MNQTEGALLGVVGGLGVAQGLEYLSISEEGLIIMTIMLVLDFGFGILDAWVRKEPIESSKWQSGLVKKATRWILPFIIAGGLKWSGMGGIEELISVIIGMIIFSELYSIIGHIYSINYKEQLPELDAFKMLLNGLIKLIKNMVDKKNKDLDTEDGENVGDESSKD